MGKGAGRYLVRMGSARRGATIGLGRERISRRSRRSTKAYGRRGHVQLSQRHRAALSARRMIFGGRAGLERRTDHVRLEVVCGFPHDEPGLRTTGHNHPQPPPQAPPRSTRMRLCALRAALCVSVRDLAALSQHTGLRRAGGWPAEVRVAGAALTETQRFTERELAWAGRNFHVSHEGHEAPRRPRRGLRQVREPPFTRIQWMFLWTSAGRAGIDFFVVVRGRSCPS